MNIRTAIGRHATFKPFVLVLRLLNKAGFGLTTSDGDDATNDPLKRRTWFLFGLFAVFAVYRLFTYPRWRLSIVVFFSLFLLAFVHTHSASNLSSSSHSVGPCPTDGVGVVERSFERRDSVVNSTSLMTHSTFCTSFGSFLRIFCLALARSFSSLLLIWKYWRFLMFTSKHSTCTS